MLPVIVTLKNETHSLRQQGLDKADHVNLPLIDNVGTCIVIVTFVDQLSACDSVKETFLISAHNSGGRLWANLIVKGVEFLLIVI